MSGLPKPYEEVLIWWKGARRVARLNARGSHFQLATFLSDTKDQYLVAVDQVDRWAAIQEVGNAHDDLVAALRDLLEQVESGTAPEFVTGRAIAALAKAGAA